MSNLERVSKMLEQERRCWEQERQLSTAKHEIDLKVIAVEATRRREYADLQMCSFLRVSGPIFTVTLLFVSYTMWRQHGLVPHSVMPAFVSVGMAALTAAGWVRYPGIKKAHQKATYELRKLTDELDKVKAEIFKLERSK
ncbi:hypothetical protein D3C87_1397100 [compost metagenome]